MALAPRASLRPVVLLLSHGKPRLSSFFSSIPTATPGTAAPTVTPPAALGGDTPVAPAVQPPPGPAGSTCHTSVAPQEGALQRLPAEDPFATAETRTHKRSSKKHPNNHQVCEDPDLGVAEGGPRISSGDKPKHQTPEPVGRSGIRDDAIDKPGGSCSTYQPLPDKVRKEHHHNHKVREDRDLPVAGGPRMSSTDNPGHPVPEP